MSTTFSPRESHSSDSLSLHYPFRVFQLCALGIDASRFLSELVPSFRTLPWDYYDVRREQTQRLLRAFPDDTLRLQRFLVDYWQERTSLGAVEDLLLRLAPGERQALESVAPYRRRAMSRFHLERTGDHWHPECLPVETHFAQGKLDTGDIRALPRVFSPLTDTVAEHPLFLRLLQGVAGLVQEVRPHAHSLIITAHQMSVVCRAGQSATNSPEGIHQDGADYIVSALVVERQGVTGGQSRVFGPDQESVLLAHTLQPGEGLFQADAGSPLWHDVTPIQHAGEGEGVRSLLGLDIRLV